MKKNFITKNLLRFNPNLVFELSKEDIEDEIIHIIAKKNIDMTLDTNNILKSNYKFLLAKIKYDSNIYVYFDKNLLSEKDYYDLFFKYFEKWPDNHHILVQYPDVLLNINLEQLFDKSLCKNVLSTYFDNYIDIPRFIKSDNYKLFETYFASDKCFELYSEFIKNIKKTEVDLRLKEKFMENIELGLKNHIYIKDFIIDTLITDVQIKDQIYSFILQNCSNLNINEYEYFLDTDFYRKYYEIYPEKLNFGNLKLPNDYIFENSNLVNYYLNQEDIDPNIFLYFSEHTTGDLKNIFLEKFNKICIKHNIEHQITNLAKDNTLINYFNDNITMYSDIQLIKIANIMSDYELPHNLAILWKNKYYIRHLINTNKLSSFICLDFFKDWPYELQNEVFNYFKDKDFNPIMQLLKKDNYDINTYSLITGEEVSFTYKNDSKTKILDFLKKIKVHNIQNNIKINYSSLDFNFLLECEQILPGKIQNLQNDLTFSIEKNDNLQILLEQLSLVANSNFDKNIKIYAPGIQHDVLPKDFLDKVNNLLPGRVFIEGKSISEIIKIDETLNNYVKSVNSYYDKSGNLKELSPYEKYISIYTIVTNYSKYIDSNDLKSSRSIYEIINSKDQKIVCGGYVTLLKVLLNRAGIYCERNNYDDNHVRAIVRIDDDKYNIHTYFICDPTWDCRHSDDVTLSRGTYNFVHLNFHDMNDKLDHLTGNDGKEKKAIDSGIILSKSELENSLNEEKLIVALANMERFVDKNQVMLDKTAISYDEYNEIAKKYARLQKLDVDKYNTTPILEITYSCGHEMLDTVISNLSVNKKLQKYGAKLVTGAGKKFKFISTLQYDEKNPYSKYLENYLNYFNFCNVLTFEENESFNDLEKDIEKYVELFISAIPSEYCERYREVGTINIPFGNNNLPPDFTELSQIIEMYESCTYNIVLLDLNGFYNQKQINSMIFNYLFNFNHSIDSESFIQWLNTINPDWKNKYSLIHIKTLATKYINDYIYTDAYNDNDLSHHR